MDLLEIVVFFEANDWIQLSYSRIDYNHSREEYEVWYRYSARTWMLVSRYKSKWHAFKSFIWHADVITAPRSDLVAFKDRDPDIKCELTDEQKIAVKIIQKDPIATDLAKDILIGRV